MNSNQSRNEEDIRFLSEVSGFSLHRCTKVLSACSGDVEAALQKLNELKKSKFEVARDMVSANILGERGFRLAIYENDALVVNVPFLLLFSVLILINIPSWVIAGALLVFVIFGMELRIEQVTRSARRLRAVDIEAYRLRRRARAAEAAVKRGGSVAKTDNDGYNEIIIE